MIWKTRSINENNRRCDLRIKDQKMEISYRIIVHNAVDWQPHDTIVLSSSSYEAHEAEVLTVKEVKGHHIRIYERLKHRHIGSTHIMEDGQQIHLAAEVGLLTRNIRIQPDSSCRGRLLVGSFRKSSGEDFSGVLQLLNVEIQNMGLPLYSSIEFTGVSAGSWVISSTVHQSCSVGIHASSSHGVILTDNVVFGTMAMASMWRVRTILSPITLSF